jgi:hypothetical protein
VFDIQAWRRYSDTNIKNDRTPRLNRKRDLLLAFATVSLPLLVIALILVSFVFNVSARERPHLFVGTSELPVTFYDTATAFYTGISPGSFLLLGSWASNIAEIVIAPFMVIFSYAVAREVLRETIEGSTTSDQRPPFLSEIIRGSHGMSTSESNAFPHNQGNKHGLRISQRIVSYGICPIH